MKALINIFCILFFSIIFLFSYSCGERVEAKTSDSSTDVSIIPSEAEAPARKITEEFKSYWYAGEAELTSYKLEQARYGELRNGHAVLIYVTEPFLAEEQVKADRSNPSNISVLKLNSTKKYLTGIYPYSIMSSTFYPVADNQHAIKVSNSVQEWCGHVYSQLNNKSEFEIKSHSYFEGEADQTFELPKAWLENEIWTKIRVNPESLPLGDIQMIPSLEFIRTGHKPMKAYATKASITEENGISSYVLEFEELNRKLQIDFTTAFPYSIEGWSETLRSGFGPNAKVLTSKATKMKVLKTAYWRQNGTEDEILRKELGI